MLASFLSLPAMAEESTQVAVVTAEPNAPLTIRLARELAQVGLQVVVVQPPDEAASVPLPSSLEAEAQGVGAFAAIRVVQKGAAVEVWIADRTTGKTVVREVIRRDGSGSVDVALVAVELLRASLLELSVPEGGEHGEVEPAPEVRALVPRPPPPAPEPVAAPSPSEPAISAALGVAVDPGFVGFRPAVGPAVSIARRVAPQVTTEVVGGVVFGGIRDDVATATTTLGFAGAGLAAEPSWGALSARLGGGMGGAVLQARGRPAADQAELKGADVSVGVAAPYVRVGGAVSVHRSLRWRVDSMLWFAFNRAVVRFEADPVAKWGRPALTVCTSLELLARP